MKLIIDIPDEYVEQLKNHTEGATAESEAVYAIRNGMPYEERPQGEWITVSHNCWKCPYCQELTNEGKNFCPNCGAKMEGDKEE